MSPTMPRPPAIECTAISAIQSRSTARACPYFDVSTRIYRFRVLNASNARTYRLGLRTALGRPMPFVLIGTDAGLLAKPIRCNDVFISPAERIDILVDLKRCRRRRYGHAGDTRVRCDAHGNARGRQHRRGPGLRVDGDESRSGADGDADAAADGRSCGDGPRRRFCRRRRAGAAAVASSRAHRLQREASDAAVDRFLRSIRVRRQSACCVWDSPRIDGGSTIASSPWAKRRSKSAATPSKRG